MTISRNQLGPSQAKQANKNYLLKESWVLMEDSLGGLESVLKVDFELTRKPRTVFAKTSQSYGCTKSSPHDCCVPSAALWKHRDCGHSHHLHQMGLL